MALAYSESSFTELIERNRPRLARLCRVYAHNEDDRKDLFQEIVYQLWKALPRFRGEAKVDSFIYRIAVNTALTHVRRKQRKPTERLDPERQSLAFKPDWAGQMDQQKQLEVLYAAIGKLSDADRTLILMYLEEISYQEMAEITGLSVNLIGVRLNRIRKRLKDLIAGEKI